MHLVILLAACSESPEVSEGVDGGVDATVSCAELAAAFSSILSGADRTCATVDDCRIVGGQVGDAWSCNCTPALGACGGNAIATSAADLDDLIAIANAYEARCSSDPTNAVCDCAPSDLSCTNERCVTQDRSCLDP